jgi:di/tricarboxylate transporter
MILTEMVSNAATAIIMTPIAISIAMQIGLDPKPFIFSVCFAAFGIIYYTHWLSN